ncbi:sodium/potassium-transporting ATPase subunit beta-like [Tenebrio molitor]|uniref:sodium/potassium-transporting ATPase subunit beta-like n=1 Tax=Tenebrio molitor TaxID=7067 RepID=UPI003624804D
MRYLRNVPSTTSTKSEFYFDRKPDNITKYQAFKRYVCNWEDGTACNRTATSWCLLLVFYITFLFLIYGLCVSMVVVAVTAIDYFTNGTLYNVSEIINPMHP